MRKLIIKLFFLDYFYKGNLALFFVEAFFYVSLASFTFSKSAGLIFSVLTLITGIIYWIIGPNKVIRRPRASFIIVPIMVIFSLVVSYQEQKIIWDNSWIIPGIFLALSVFLGFWYFDFKPVKFYECSDSQKYQYGYAIKSGSLTKAQSTYTDVDWFEYDILESYMKAEGLQY